MRFSVALIMIIYISLPNAHAQSEGIAFEKGLSWAEVVAKAKAQNKYIFVDCWASWCGPCKWMDKNIFPKKAVGDFMNAHFISFAVQMDAPAGNTDEAKQRYQRAQEMDAKFAIKTLPTYLFFAPDGTPVHKMATGAVNSEQIFISKSQDALHPARQYYSVLSAYSQHKGDSVYLQQALTAVLEAKDSSAATVIGELYLASIKAPLAADAIKLIQKSVTTTTASGFVLLVNNADQIGKTLGAPAKTHFLIGSIVGKELLEPIFTGKTTAKLDYDRWIAELKKKYPGLQAETIENFKLQFDTKVRYYGVRVPIYAKGAPTPDWKRMEAKLKKQYPSTDVHHMIAEEKPRYYNYYKDPLQCAKTATEYLQEYGGELTEKELNNLVWDYFFMRCTDSTLLRQAVPWIKRAVDIAPNNYQNLDTYANLLYKLGEKELAIINESKAIALIEQLNPNDTTNLKELRESKRKMISGEPTWQVAGSTPSI